MVGRHLLGHAMEVVERSSSGTLEQVEVAENVNKTKEETLE